MRRTIPFIRQMEYADCGAACLAMVLGYFGKRVDLRELRDMTGAGRDGVTALSVVTAARTYGLRVRGVRADLDDLRYLPRGSILHWEFSHFVVFERTTRKGIRVVDPARGRRVVSMADLRHAYTGVAILCEPSDGFDRGRSRVKGTWRYLRPMLRQSRNMIRVVATSLIIRLAALGLPLLTLLVVDEIVPRDDHHLLVVFAAGVGMVIGFNFLSAFLRANLLLELQTRFDMGLTMGFIDHLVKLPYSFFLRRSSGDLMMRLQSNTAVRDILATSTMSAVLDGAFATVYLALLFVISPVLAVVVLVLAVLEVSVMVLSWRRNQRLMSRSLQAQADAQSYAYELLAGIETLKASGGEHRAVDHWGGLFTDQINIDLTRGRLGAAVSSVMSTLQIASPLIILMVGAFQVLAGHISLGTMLSASALGTGFLQPLGTMISSGLQLQMLGSYMQRINDVLDTPSEQHGENVGPAPQLSGQIRADDVSFSYGPLAPTVVSGVSLEIQPGQHIGIVGRSGSGKSTLAHLLLGLYRPTSGHIEFDGLDLGGLDAGSVRRQLGIVTQRPYVFASSVRENIALTNPELPLDVIVEAAKIACVHDDIAAMPMGYDTQLHDGGASVSGGQRQRIALARALVHRPSILLLDEATSELDTVTEQKIYTNLDVISSTTIVIAHRLSTIRNADLILVMDQGRIVEAGSHEQLVSRQGAYAALVHAQSGTGQPAASLNGTARDQALLRAFPP
ncbi:MAG TPA: peptidase domain-containing ABC transporter [Trebonia sp.]|nr:peptidase domain-containing ABC transporter [Trebonia sp.]